MISVAVTMPRDQRTAPVISAAVLAGRPTVTLAVAVPTPPSWSVTFSFAVYVPAKLYVHAAVAPVASVVPLLSQSHANVSTSPGRPGSVAVPVTEIGTPAAPLYGPPAFAVGATLCTVTVAVYVVEPPSLSVTVPLPVIVP